MPMQFWPFSRMHRHIFVLCGSNMPHSSVQQTCGATKALSTLREMTRQDFEHGEEFEYPFSFIDYERKK